MKLKQVVMNKSSTIKEKQLIIFASIVHNLYILLHLNNQNVYILMMNSFTIFCGINILSIYCNLSIAQVYIVLIYPLFISDHMCISHVYYEFIPLNNSI